MRELELTVELAVPAQTAFRLLFGDGGAFFSAFYEAATVTPWCRSPDGHLASRTCSFTKRVDMPSVLVSVMGNNSSVPVEETQTFFMADEAEDAAHGGGPNGLAARRAPGTRAVLFSPRLGGGLDRFSTRMLNVLEEREGGRCALRSRVRVECSLWTARGLVEAHMEAEAHSSVAALHAFAAAAACSLGPSGAAPPLALLPESAPPSRAPASPARAPPLPPKPHAARAAAEAPQYPLVRVSLLVLSAPPAAAEEEEAEEEEEEEEEEEADPAALAPTSREGPSALAAALAAARADAVALRQERRQADAAPAEAGAHEELLRLLSAERAARTQAELRLRSCRAALSAERDTLAARCATLERERGQFADLGRVRAAAEPPAGWLAWVAAPREDAAGAMRAVQQHLVTVTTDRDLLAAELYKSILTAGAAAAERDEAEAALAEATEQLRRMAEAQVASPARSRSAPLEGLRGGEIVSGHSSS